jgi:hypothetical protein
MKLLVTAAIGVFALGPAVATPILLNSAGFTTAIAPLAAVVENFEGFSVGNKPSTLVLANSTYSSNSVFIANGFISPTHTLINNAPDPSTGRIFSSFAQDTVLFGLQIGAFGLSDILDITVVGRDGTLVLQQSISSFGGFIGFQDAQGLISVTFKDIGTGFGAANYDFDNVTTAAASIPEPASIALVGAALAGMGLSRRRKV